MNWKEWGRRVERLLKNCPHGPFNTWHKPQWGQWPWGAGSLGHKIIGETFGQENGAGRGDWLSEGVEVRGAGTWGRPSLTAWEIRCVMEPYIRSPDTCRSNHVGQEGAEQVWHFLLVPDAIVSRKGLSLPGMTFWLSASAKQLTPCLFTFYFKKIRKLKLL